MEKKKLCVVRWLQIKSVNLFHSSKTEVLRNNRLYICRAIEQLALEGGQGHVIAGLIELCLGDGLYTRDRLPQGWIGKSTAGKMGLIMSFFLRQKISFLVNRVRPPLQS